MEEESIEQAQHAQWLQNPITQRVLKAIDIHKNKIQEKAFNDSKDFSVCAESVRQGVSNIRTMGACIILITNFDAMNKVVEGKVNV